MSLSFPLEIVERFIGFLEPVGSLQNAEALRRCALVCRAWTWPSRIRLFYAVVIPEDDLHLVSELLSHSPHLGRLIHELHIESSPERHIGTNKLPGCLYFLLPNLTTLKYDGIVASLDLLGIPHIRRLIFTLEQFYIVKIDPFKSFTDIHTLEISIQGRLAFPTFIIELGKRSGPTFPSLRHLCLEYKDFIFRVYDDARARIKLAMDSFFSIHTTIKTIELILPSNAIAFPDCA
jgi:hypothetical protein